MIHKYIKEMVFALWFSLVFVNASWLCKYKYLAIRVIPLIVYSLSALVIETIRLGRDILAFDISLLLHGILGAVLKTYVFFTMAEIARSNSYLILVCIVMLLYSFFVLDEYLEIDFSRNMVPAIIVPGVVGFFALTFLYYEHISRDSQTILNIFDSFKQPSSSIQVINIFILFVYVTYRQKYLPQRQNTDTGKYRYISIGLFGIFDLITGFSRAKLEWNILSQLDFYSLMFVFCLLGIALSAFLEIYGSSYNELFFGIFLIICNTFIGLLYVVMNDLSCFSKTPLEKALFVEYSAILLYIPANAYVLYRYREYNLALKELQNMQVSEDAANAINLIPSNH